jgi:hypothetical protein
LNPRGIQLLDAIDARREENRQARPAARDSADELYKKYIVLALTNESQKAGRLKKIQLFKLFELVLKHCKNNVPLETYLKLQLGQLRFSRCYQSLFMLMREECSFDEADNLNTEAEFMALCVWAYDENPL